MRTAARVVLAMLIGLLGVWFAPRADAACHSFSVKAKSPVTEGDKVTVTVSRDNNLDSSSVQVQTANVTAKGGADYEPTIQRVEFTNETSRTIQIATIEDNVGEPTETFQVKLNSARGCRTFNTNYQYGPPAVVSITDDDGNATAAPTTAPSTEPAATSKATAKPTPSASPSSSPTAEPTETPLETIEPFPTEEPSNDEGLSPWLVAVAVGALVLAAAGAVIATRMRRSRT